MSKKITVTIDGGSGVGKGTISKLIAQKLQYQLIDSGAMYRTMSCLLYSNSISPNDVTKEHLSHIKFYYIDSKLYVSYKNKNEDKYENKHEEEHFEVEQLPIRTQENSQNSSKYAVITIIREHVTTQIKEIMSKGGFVLEGRDAGSVIYPQAQVKFYIECPIDVRAKRRLEDYKQKGILYTQLEVEQELEERDHRDMNRETDPLIIPKNAFIITNDDSKTLDKRVEEMINIIEYTISKL
ncbi:MAG: (d)CMP kinase [Nanoarchaeota archaeon]|nr:(d)CMP kinase [Nanoarchaeota archaeon]